MTMAVVEHAKFENRKSVGIELANRLAGKTLVRPVVLALPRGGVPVGAEIARRLDAPMDLLMVRKIGVPGHEELALGAVVDEPAPQLTINEAIRESCGIGDAELAELESRQLQEIARRRALYLHGRAPVAIEGSTAIIVDDGMATGATVKAALSAVRAQHPAELILAIGVAPPEQLGMLYPEVTDIICLHQPDPFHSVGFYYQDFSEVSDQEVVDLLDSVGDRG